jgi:hypothetical protein
MIWYKYNNPFNDEEIVITVRDDGAVWSGIAEHMPEYLAWVADGNTATDWQPVEQTEGTN